jgi:hypothetical protein
VLQDPDPELEQLRQHQEVRARRHSSPSSRWSPTSATRPTSTARSATFPRDAGQRSQPDVPHQRDAPLLARPGPKMSDDDKKIIANYKKLPRQVDPLHPHLGQGRRRSGARPRNDGRLEAHRRHRRREDRQDHLTYAQGAVAELTAMCTILAAIPTAAGQYDARPLFRRRRHDGGEQERPADVHHARYRAGLGLHAARLRRSALGLPLLALQHYTSRSNRDRRSATTSAPSSTSSSPTTPPPTAASRSARSPAAIASPPSPSTTTPSAASSNPSNRR